VNPHRHLVLVVEDELFIRLDVADALQSEGLEVIALSNGDDALELIKSRPEVRAIFTDINMPGSIDGLGLVKFVAANYPDIALFVASGRESSSMLKQLPQRVRFYAKPFVVTELVEAIKASTG
jgi:two-component system, response regulator PdtaR